VAEVVVRVGGFALFDPGNTSHLGEDSTRWVLGRIDQALADVSRQQSIAL
jgi:hypothetical protein